MQTFRVRYRFCVEQLDAVVMHTGESRARSAIPGSGDVVRKQLDQWLERGLLDPAAHARLAEDLARSAGEESASPGRSGGPMLEAVGYAGAALIVAAAAPLWFSFSLPPVADMLLTATIAVIAFVACLRLSGGDSPAVGRLSSMLVAVATGAGAAAAHLAGRRLVGPVQYCDAWLGTPNCTDPTWVTLAVPDLLGVAAGVPIAVVLYRRVRRAVAVTTLTVATLGGVSVVMDALLELTVWGYATRELVVGVVIVVAATIWVLLSERGLLTPTTTATVVGTIVLGIGLATLTWDSVGFLVVALVLSAGYVVAGVRAGRLRLTICGAAGVLVFTPNLLVEGLGLAPVTVALVLLPVGAAMLGWVVWAARR